jgi:hypothetical protein
MAIEIFNRHENKYQISEKVFVALQDKLTEFMEIDAYNNEYFTYPVCNIYYDTDDSYLIRTSLSKPSYKEKLRLRSYGTPIESSTVYVEIKKKFRGMTNKRRSGMKPDEAYNFLATGNLPIQQQYMNWQVLREVKYMLSQRELKPAVYLSYKRRAFRTLAEDKNSDLRVSFDTAITTRRKDLRLESGVWGEDLLPKGQWLMEIKTAQAIPMWLTGLLSEYRIYPASFSKYGAEYQMSINHQLQEQRKTSALFPAPFYRETDPSVARS